MPDDLTELFPDLASTLQGMAGSHGFSSALEADPNHSGVTDADVEAYFQSRMTPVQFRAGEGIPASTLKNEMDGPDGTTEPVVNPDDEHQDTGDRQVPSPSPTQSEPQPNESETVRQPFQEGDPDEAPAKPNESSGTEEASGGNGPTAQPTFVEVDGQQVPLDTVKAFLQFNEYLATNPELASTIREHFSKGSQPQPVQSEPVATQPLVNLPEEFRDDPVAQAFLPVLQAQQQQLTQLSAVMQQQYADQAERAKQENDAVVNRAVATFKQTRNLEDSEIAELRQIAGNLNVLPSLLRGVDPFTNQPSNPDPIAAVERALDIAYHSTPKFREKENQRLIEERRNERQKRQRLGALSGSSGSTPRNPSPPRNDQERHSAMVGEVAAMLSGSWSDPNEERT